MSATPFSDYLFDLVDDLPDGGGDVDEPDGGDEGVEGVAEGEGERGAVLVHDEEGHAQVDAEDEGAHDQRELDEQLLAEGVLHDLEELQEAVAVVQAAGGGSLPRGGRSTR